MLWVPGDFKISAVQAIDSFHGLPPNDQCYLTQGITLDEPAPAFFTQECFVIINQLPREKVLTGYPENSTPSQIV